mmetsp:Transcript_15991/g.32852  ORF Transcript_15991/g.32852 Transcript_15991/m.32852 type:complete len:364 (+) Transcript_15991:6048-7139(+)
MEKQEIINPLKSWFLRSRTNPSLPFFNHFSSFLRPLNSLLQNGLINIDKPCNVNVNEIETKVKSLLGIEKVRSLGRLEKKLSGCLVLLLENSIFFAKKPISPQEEFVGVFKINPSLGHFSFKLEKLFEKMSSFLLQSIFPLHFPSENFVFQEIKSSFLLNSKKKIKKLTFFFSCESGFNLQTFSSSLNAFLGKKNLLKELRRIRVGNISEEDFLLNFHDLVDAIWFYRSKKNDFFIRKSVLPLEFFLIKYRKIIVKNSSVNALCYGANLNIQGILGLEKNIEKGEEIILSTIKGETVALALSELNTRDILCIKFGLAAKIKGVIMLKDYYPKQWGLGLSSVKKRILLSTGIIKKPRDWIIKRF